MASWTDVDFSKLKALASFEESEPTTDREHVPTAPGAPVRVQRPKRKSIHPAHPVKQVVLPSDGPAIYHTAPKIPTQPIQPAAMRHAAFNPSPDPDATQPGLPARRAPIRPAPQVPIQPSVFSPPLPLNAGRRAASNEPFNDDCTIPLIHTARALKQSAAQPWSPPEVEADSSNEQTSIGYVGQRSLEHADLIKAHEEKTDPRANSPKPNWHDEFGATDPDFDDKTTF